MILRQTINTVFPYTTLFRSGLMAGTHNEESSKLLAEEMVSRGISPKNEHIFFAQLLGMSDNLSFNLAASGFRSEEHTSELQSRENLVCRLLLEKKIDK